MAGFKLTVSPSLKKLFDSKSKEGLIPKVRKDFSKRGPIKVKQAIIQDIIKGISPVKGKGKLKKYSQSYKDVIQDKAAFRTVNGKVLAIKSGKKRSDRSKIAKLNRDFHSKASPKKRISPINMRLSGDMHRSLKVFTRGGILRKFRLVTQFRHFLADIHNRLGAGKSKVIRRLLPTNKGEQFNKRITDVLLTQLKKSVERVAKEFSRQ